MRNYTTINNFATTLCCIGTHQPSGWSLSPVCPERVSLGSNIFSGPLDDVAEPDTDVPPDGFTDVELIMGLIIWPKKLKKKKSWNFKYACQVIVVVDIYNQIKLLQIQNLSFQRWLLQDQFVNLWAFLKTK